MRKLTTRTLMPDGPEATWARRFSPLLDHLLGVPNLDRAYQEGGFEGLDVHTFTNRFVEFFELNLRRSENIPHIFPSTGRCIIVGNHPFGGIEGVSLAKLLLDVRPDVKVLANRGLSIFPELQPLFIFTNPLKSNAKGNRQSIEACAAHLEADGCLVLFPAGRVSYPARRGDPVLDHRWNRMVASLAKRFSCPVIPVFVQGQNRPHFYELGHLHKRMRMFLLLREMMASKGRPIGFYAGKPVTTLPAAKDTSDMTKQLRLLTYLQDPSSTQSWPAESPPELQPIATPIASEVLAAEVAALPADQTLVEYKTFSVHYAMRSQVPNIVEEIRRLREESFRELDEGSGNPVDGDDFDDTYTQLFIFDQANKALIGAYRMGRTDLVQQNIGREGLYLHRMFEFGDDFINQTGPCLEMGRSFLVASQQRSFHGLLLLFKGIGAFVCKYPQYRHLYGTVSLSKQYTPLSVHLIQRFLAEPDAGATPRKAFEHPDHPELLRYLEDGDRDIRVLEDLVKQIEPDGKGLPALVKQYHQLGARFYCTGIDPNFASTPGLLLSVHLPDTSRRLLKLFLGDKAEGYLAYEATS